MGFKDYVEVRVYGSGVGHRVQRVGGLFLRREAKSKVCQLTRQSHA
jgi:hypothetical protein